MTPLQRADCRRREELEAENQKLLERVAELVEALNVTVGEFFEDGLSADLAEGEITTLPEAYVEGYRDAENEVKGRLRTVLAKHDKHDKAEFKRKDWVLAQAINLQTIDTAHSQIKKMREALHRAFAVICTPIPLINSTLLNDAADLIKAALVPAPEPKPGESK